MSALTDTATEVRDVAIVGAGFSGLAAAYELARRGASVTLIEAGPEVGGLAAAFETDGERLDRFYHHWFTNDRAVMDLVADLGLESRVETRASRTGMYYANSFFRLSTPMDLMRFTPLAVHDRVRLGLLALRARRVGDWRALEDLTAAEWLKRLGGEKVWQVVWEPLLRSKFGPHADEISAVWFWNKLKLRGGSRGKGGEERLAYFKGGFAALAEEVASAIGEAGGEILLQSPVERIEPDGDLWRVRGHFGAMSAKRVVATPALPLIADMIDGWAPTNYLAELRRIAYLANICLVLELDRALSDTYWINVNDPTFPFVGVIEHTNFERPESYGGSHIVYLSKYLPASDPLYAKSADEVLAFALPHLKRMFPAFEDGWLKRHHLWKARWAQPVVERRYSALIPAEATPFPGFSICSMAQVYPEDRGTNYAIRAGRKLGTALEL